MHVESERTADQRLLLVESNDCIGPPRGESEPVSAGELFAVVLVWPPDEPGVWTGWLTTVDHRALRFTMGELEDVAFQRWLCRLPDWDPTQLSVALGRPGLHLVWRRPED